MKIPTLLTLSMLVFTSTVQANNTEKWGYSGSKGPDNWAKLSSDNYACQGKNQSPINLTGFIEASLDPIKFEYQSGGEKVKNNGHTVQVDYNKGSYITVDGIKFNLLQFHFHAPSENHINGKSYPLEAHFVHADSKGNLAVIAQLFSEGTEHNELAQIWAQMPMHVHHENKLTKLVNATSLLATSKDYYRFNGSLTTPPCSEGVRWFVMKNMISASKVQIEAFSQVLHEANNRPIQALNARTILQ